MRELRTVVKEHTNSERTSGASAGRRQIASPQRLAASFDVWATRDWSDGIQLDSCPALEQIVVRTLNSVYEVIVLGGSVGEVLVRGGRFFPDFCRARIAGATAGGSTLKLVGIYVGLRMELHIERQSIVTSLVQAISRRAGSSQSM